MRAGRRRRGSAVGAPPLLRRAARRELQGCGRGACQQSTQPRAGGRQLTYECASHKPPQPPQPTPRSVFWREMGNIGSQVGGWPVQAADATALWDKLVGGRAQRESGAIIVYPQSTGDAGSRQVRPRSVGWWVGRRCGGESGASVVPYAPSHPLSPPPPTFKLAVFQQRLLDLLRGRVHRQERGRHRLPGAGGSKSVVCVVCLFCCPRAAPRRTAGLTPHSPHGRRSWRSCRGASTQTPTGSTCRVRATAGALYLAASYPAALCMRCSRAFQRAPARRRHPTSPAHVF